MRNLQRRKDIEHPKSEILWRGRGGREKTGMAKGRVKGGGKGSDGILYTGWMKGKEE